MSWKSEIKRVYDSEKSRREEIKKKLGELILELRSETKIEAEIVKETIHPTAWVVSIEGKSFQITESDVTMKQKGQDLGGWGDSGVGKEMDEVLQDLLVEKYKQ